jgi:hypothetical protein
MCAGSYEEFDPQAEVPAELIKASGDPAVDQAEEDEYDEYADDLGGLDELIRALLGDEGPVPDEDVPGFVPGQSLINYELEVRAFASWSESVPMLNTENIYKSIDLIENGQATWEEAFQVADEAVGLVALLGGADHGPTDQDYVRARLSM